MSTPEADRPASYPRSTGTARGRQRQQELLERVTEDLAANGLADFSLRRAARAAGTTHKVILYHFGGVEDLLGQAMLRLRDRRIENAMDAARGRGTLAERVAAMWPVLAEDATGLRVIDQAIGLAMYDPARYAHLARQAADQYVGPLESLCPPQWSARRKREVTEMIMATFRGFLAEWRTSSDAVRIDAGLAALTRALQREEAAAE